MRRFVVAAFMAVSAQSAFAADLPILRGSYSEPPPQRSRASWEGFYVGGQAAAANSMMDFTKTVQPLTAFITRESIFQDILPKWELLGHSNVNSTGFGGFVGYNIQWDDAVIGFEANYTHFKGKMAGSAGSLSRLYTNPTGSSPPAGHDYIYDVTLAGDAASRVNDVLTLRARGGWSAGSFMPYAFAGLAVASVNAQRSATLTQIVYDRFEEPAVPPATAPIRHFDFLRASFDTKAENQKNLLTFGFSAGVGVEFLVMQNIFLRAEYEYIQLPLAKDTIIQMHAARAGAGLKF